MGRRRAGLRHAGPGDRRDGRHPRPDADRQLADRGLAGWSARRRPGRRELLRGDEAARPGRACGLGPDRAVIGPNELERLQPLIAESGVDGWLLFDFRGRNPIAVGGAGQRDRREPARLRAHPACRTAHRAGPRRGRGALARLAAAMDQAGVGAARDAGRRSWAGWSGGSGSRWTSRPTARSPIWTACPPASRSWIRSLGATLVPSADLVTRYCSVWTAEDVASHRRAAAAIAAIAREAPDAGRRRGRRASDERARAGGLDSRAVRPRGAGDRGRPERELGAQRGAHPLRADGGGERADRARRAAAAGPLGQGAGRDLRRPDLDGGDRRAERAGRASSGRWSAGRATRHSTCIGGRVRSGKPVHGAEGDAAAKRVIAEAGLPGATPCRAPATRSTGTASTGSGRRSTTPRRYDDRLLMPGRGILGGARRLPAGRRGREERGERRRGGAGHPGHARRLSEGFARRLRAFLQGAAGPAAFPGASRGKSEKL